MKFYIVSKKIEKFIFQIKFLKKFHPSKNKKPLTGQNTVLGHNFRLVQPVNCEFF